jgi:hypothetical protein
MGLTGAYLCSMTGVDACLTLHHNDWNVYEELLQWSQCAIICSGVCYSFEQLGVVQDNRVCRATKQLSADSQKQHQDSFDNEGGRSDCAFVGQERYKQKLRRSTNPGESALRSDTHNKRLSEEMILATQSGSRRGKKLHYCQSCAIVFPNYHSLLQHNCNRSGKEALKCSICNESFFEKETLAVHVLVHSGTLSFSRWRKAVDMWVMQAHSPVLGVRAARSS